MTTVLWRRSLAAFTIVAGHCYLVLDSYRTVTALMVYEPTRRRVYYDCETLTPCTSTYTNVPFLAKQTTFPAEVTPLSTQTTRNNLWDLEIVSIFLPGGAVPRSDLLGYNKLTTDPIAVEIEPTWVIDITLTAPVSCPTPFEFTIYSTFEYFYRPVPLELSALLGPKATVQEATKTYTRAIVAATHGARSTTLTQTLPGTHTTFHIRPTDLPPKLRPDMSYGEIRSLNKHYIQNCYRPGEESPQSKAAKCPYKYGGVCSKTAPWVIVVAVLISFIFLLGAFENFFWFRRLMQGKGCLRSGTVCWCLIGTLFMVFFTTYERKRSPEDQARLKEQWKAIPLGMKMKLWFKWGFRHKYPVEWLGVRKTVGEEESIEMGSSGRTGDSGPGATGRENDMPLPVYPGHPSSNISDTHSMNSGTTVATPGPALGNPNAVLAPVLGSGTVVIGPTMTSTQPQTLTPRPAADDGAVGDGFRAV